MQCVLAHDRVRLLCRRMQRVIHRTSLIIGVIFLIIGRNLQGRTVGRNRRPDLQA
jgi:hypothetical protein